MNKKQEVLPTDELQKIFSEILCGRSDINWSGQTFFIKHFNNLSYYEIEQYKQKERKRLAERGILTLEEKLEVLALQDLWTSEDEQEFQSKKELVAALSKNKKNFSHLERERKFFQKQMEEAEEQYWQVDQRRRTVLGEHLETFLVKKMNNFWVFKSLYRDSELTQPAFSWEDFQDLSTHELGGLINTFVKNSDNYSDFNIKSIALQPFFINIFGMTDSVYEFFGTAISKLTFNQVNLVAAGKNFKYILSRSDTSHLTEAILRNPEELEDWFVGYQKREQLNMKSGRQTNVETEFVSHVGATSKDYGDSGEKVTGIKELLGQQAEMGIQEMIEKGLI